MTGIGIGMSLNGKIPIMVHQRLDFFLLAMDQLVNSAAKWYYMFGSKKSVPITIRLIVGRGWGQGPTHSQSLQSWFNHIPGIKVVAPTTPHDAKGCLISSIRDNNPVIFVEHRMLYSNKGFVPEKLYEVDFGKMASNYGKVNFFNHLQDQGVTDEISGEEDDVPVGYLPEKKLGSGNMSKWVTKTIREDKQFVVNSIDQVIKNNPADWDKLSKNLIVTPRGQQVTIGQWYDAIVEIRNMKNK